jgi:hypothetical protein
MKQLRNNFSKKKEISKMKRKFKTLLHATLNWNSPTLYEYMVEIEPYMNTAKKLYKSSSRQRLILHLDSAP